MKLREYKGEEALDVLADLIDPITEICQDTDMIQMLQDNGKVSNACKMLLKNHKKQVIEIMAAIDRKDPDEYQINVFTLPMKLLDILNDPDVQKLFTSQGQQRDAKFFGSALEKEKE